MDKMKIVKRRYTINILVRIPGFGHAGDGDLHDYICRDELGGPVSGEQGIGYAKKGYLDCQYGEAPQCADAGNQDCI